jgi:hypothetical protein
LAARSSKWGPSPDESESDEGSADTNEGLQELRHLTFLISKYHDAHSANHRRVTDTTEAILDDPTCGRSDSETAILVARDCIDCLDSKRGGDASSPPTTRLANSKAMGASQYRRIGTFKKRYRSRQQCKTEG